MSEKKNQPDLIYMAVEKIAISPADAMAVVDSYKKQVLRIHPQIDKNEVQKIIAAKIVNRYAKISATSGGITSLTSIVPGLGTAASMLAGGTMDVAISMKLQVDMVMCIAAAYDYDLNNEDAKHMSFLIAGLGALEQAGTTHTSKLASKAGVKMIEKYLKGATLETIKRIFSAIGINFTKSALKKSLPFGVGVVVSSSTNYGLTKFVGKQTIDWFIYDAQEKAAA
ncbi:EcsC family protein [Acinetobacter pittii]|uniref:EcsC family protein n=1 Tax=Acinetobacter pittii TaxID=48296 RepID=UPI000AB7F7EC|nr:EcsC family protein [Acinetobacter pittii]